MLLAEMDMDDEKDVEREERLFLVDVTREARREDFRPVRGCGEPVEERFIIEVLVSMAGV